MSQLTRTVNLAAQAAGSNHGIPVGWIGFCVLVAVALSLIIRWARKRGGRS